MQWSPDRTGFPVLDLPELGLAVHLLPVSKPQFERFLAQPVMDGGIFGDSWYESVLAVSPRVSIRDAQPANYESLFLGGILPSEAERFARWLGTGYDLPKVESWRQVDEYLSMHLLDEAEVEAMKSDERLCRSARQLLAWRQATREPLTWGELGLLHGGLLEWVRIGPRQFGGLGRPRQEFQRILINPQRDEPVKPIQQQRLRYFGFRLVRPL